MAKAPFNRLAFAPPAVEVTPLKDGGCVLRSPQALGPYGRSIGEWLVHWGETRPDQLFLAERAPSGGWWKLSYGAALAQVRAVAQALIHRRLSTKRPVAILSDNGIDHAILAMAAMHAGVPVAPVSPSYSLASRDYGKLKHVLGLLQPGLVYVNDAAKFAPALGAVKLRGAKIVTSGPHAAGVVSTPFAELAATKPLSQVDNAFRRVGPDTVAKILFTSGSTDLPKGVVNTQRMLCANQQAIAQIWPFLAEKPPVIVDWLPWSHTFGGNHNFNMMLRHGGTIWIDEGKPAPGLVERTVANLGEVSPTIYFNVPRGYDMLLPRLESDEKLRANFFRRLDLIFYAAAALPQNLWERLEAVALAARGERVRMVSSWGSTETAPLVTSVHFEMERAGVIGLPVPGVELKMVPNAGKMELRVRGPNVTPGYYRRPDLTKAAFDEDGYYQIGDAGRFAVPGAPIHGIEFDGRIAEDFKLSSGTWVHVGGLRVRAIAAGAPAIQDCVVTGHDRSEVGLLIFPNPAGCRALCPDLDHQAPLGVLLERPEVRLRIAQALATLAQESAGSSTHPTRALLMDEPPSGDANEITDKGYVNQRAVLTRRAALVERLHAAKPDAQVIAPTG
ncbi:MAG: feruloyl-CoA synthase [Burkholderiales bacterium]